MSISGPLCGRVSLWTFANAIGTPGQWWFSWTISRAEDSVTIVEEDEGAEASSSQ